MKQTQLDIHVFTDKTHRIPLQFDGIIRRSRQRWLIVKICLNVRIIRIVMLQIDYVHGTLLAYVLRKCFLMKWKT